MAFTAVGVGVMPQNALAGGVNTDTGHFSAAIYNATPYTWTLVKVEAPQSCADYVSGGCWQTRPAATIAPGQAAGYSLAQNYQEIYQLFSSYVYGYNGWFTYRVDVAGAAPEYVTVAISQAFRNGVYGNALPELRQFITTTPPPDDYNPGRNPDPYPAPQVTAPQFTYDVGTPYAYDLTYTLIGEHTFDATTGEGEAFAKLLNGLCASAAGTTCSFDQDGPIAWTSGNAGAPYASANCSPPGGGTSTLKVDYKVSQSAAFTVGGGIAVGVEFKLGDVFANSVTVSVEASHEWRETTSFTRSASISVPAGNIGLLWVVPTVATVTGTLTLTSPHSKFVVTNFSETRSGVSRGDFDAAYHVISFARPMTSGELSAHCPPSATTVTAGGR